MAVTPARDGQYPAYIDAVMLSSIESGMKSLAVPVVALLQKGDRVYVRLETGTHKRPPRKT
ncbi:MAG: hypothetical protein WDM88_09140 [Galbitalea sp.]